MTPRLERAATRIQSWNRELVAARREVRGFSGWREVPNLLPVL